MRVTRQGAFPEEEKQLFGNNQLHFCYSEELVKEVVQFFDLSTSPQIVDLGAGIGALSSDFMNAVPLARITAVDPYIPNQRPHPITARLEACPNFRYHQGSAELTGLTPMSTDLIICGQAFSYMKMEDTIIEAKRILRPGCGVALFFIHGSERACSGLEEFIFEVERPPPPTEFMEKFWALLRSFFLFSPLKRRQLHAFDIEDPETTAYKQAMRTIPVMKSFFLDGICTVKTVCELWGQYNFVELCQLARWDQDEDDEQREATDESWREYSTARDLAVQKQLKKLFDKYAVDGTVDFYHYVTVFYGHMTKPFLAELEAVDSSVFSNTSTS